MTDKITPEDRHIEAAIRAANDAWTLPDWSAPAVHEHLYDRDVRGTIGRSIMAHAETLAMVERALNAIEWEAARENGNILHFKRCVLVQLRAALSNPKDK